jgi:putative flavoprotein involved in K+ transport
VSAGVLVIGGGPAGMAAADALGRAGVAFDWIDREGAVGGAYARLHPSMELASPARYSELPGLPLESAGEYVTVGDYAAYLSRYAARLGRAPSKASITGLSRENGGLRADSGSGLIGRYRAAVIATGMFDYPRPAVFPGLPGPPLVTHARDWRGAAAFAGRRLLIVGGGMTGTEFAEDCARAGVPVALSARSGIRLTPRKILGLEVHDWAALLERLPAIPWSSLCRGEFTLPGVDLGFRRFVKEGRVRVLPAAESFAGPRVRFAGGHEEEFDAIVLATGYRHEVPFLPPDFPRHGGGIPKLRGGRGRGWPELHFVGFPCAGGPASEFLRGMGPDAARAARRIKDGA